MSRVTSSLKKWKEGIISDSVLAHHLRFDDWATNYSGNIKQGKVYKRLLEKGDHSCFATCPSALRGLVLNDEMVARDNFIALLPKLLSERDFNLYYLFYVENYSQLTLAKMFGMKKSAVSMAMIRSNEKIRRFLESSPEYAEEVREALRTLSTED